MSLFQRKPSGKEAYALVNEKLNALRLSSFDQLALLPKSVTEEVILYNKKLSVTTYRDILPDQRVRIVVQVCMRAFIGSYVSADGFILSRDNSVSPVPREMLWEFC